LRGMIGVDRILMISVVSALLAVGAYYVLTDSQVRNAAISGMATMSTSLWMHATHGDVVAIAIIGALGGVTIYLLHTFRDILYTALIILLLAGSIQGAIDNHQWRAKQVIELGA